LRFGLLFIAVLYEAIGMDFVERAIKDREKKFEETIMFAMLGKMKLVAVAAVAATGLAAGAQKASAHDHFSFGLSIGLPVITAPAPVYTPAPVYVAPAPVYAAPAVVIQPAPVVVYQPAPVYYRPYYAHGWGYHGWHR
jgi:hypothetical protein